MLEQMRGIANKRGNGKTPVREKPSGPAMMGSMTQDHSEGDVGRANSR